MRFNITIRNSKNDQANYLCFLAKNLIIGKYQQAGFAITSYQKQGCMYFPDLGYSNIFWKRLSASSKFHFHEKFSNLCIHEIVNKTYCGQKKAIPIHNLLENIAMAINSIEVLKNAFSKIHTFDILVTPYGLSGSYFSKKDKSGWKLFMSLRDDLPIESLSTTVLRALQKIILEDIAEVGELSWYVREARVATYLNFPAIKALILSEKKPTNKDFIHCQNYLTTLGLNPTSRFSQNKKGIYYDKKNLDAILSKQETDTLRLLIQNSFASYDQIASVLWGDEADERFSLEAIAKVIYNIRRQLCKIGIYKKTIRNIRAKGYCLDN